MDTLNINPGDLRTRIRVQKRESSRKPGEIASKTEWVDIGNISDADPPRYKRCQWIGAHGDADYVDDKGFKRRVYRLDSYPGDEGYTSFGSTVPAPKMATA